MHELCSLTIDVPEHILSDLKSRYAEPHRKYHTWDHILSMFDTACRFGIELSDNQQWAILFHDAIYDPLSKTNEEDSSNLMCEMLVNVVTLEDNSIIAGMILETANHTLYNPTLSKQTKQILDLDLYTFSIKKSHYTIPAIYNEFLPYIDAEQFFTNRKEFLQALLDKERIYYLDLFDENVARYNIEFELMMIKYFI